MAETYDLIIKGGQIVTHAGRAVADLGVRDGRIAAIGALDPARADEAFDASGLTILPGVIDSQVHFREPGLTHKEDFESGSRAAALGGVTSVFEMPNTDPPTTSVDAIADKVARATGRFHVDFAFYAGATMENADRLNEIERAPGCCGVKVFMGSSTGSLLVATDEGVETVLRSARRRVTFHSEDEARLKARKSLAREGDVLSHPEVRDAETARLCTERLLRIARRAGARIHVLHVTTADEIPLLAGAKDFATVEITPQHLTLAAPEAYERLGTLAQMNPPIRDAAHRDGLWRAVAEGVADVIGSDHAPHTLEEKARPYPASPSGMPGVQTLVPVMLDHVAQGRLSLERFVDLTSAGPARVFGLSGKGRLARGYDADFTIVDLEAKRTIENRWIATKAGWTPFDGMAVTGWPAATVVRGRTVMRDDEIVASGTGAPARFLETLAHD